MSSMLSRNEFAESRASLTVRQVNVLETKSIIPSKIVGNELHIRNERLIHCGQIALDDASLQLWIDFNDLLRNGCMVCGYEWNFDGSCSVICEHTLSRNTN